MRYEDLSKDLKVMLKKHGVSWDEYKRVYFTKLHKDFYLKESEAKSEGHLQEFCRLINYLKGQKAYGVDRDWANSELNKYAYKLDKKALKKKFPLTVEALARFYNDSDIMTFYKKVLKTQDPTIIDLVGPTGAGKTTFCQQYCF